MAVPSADELKPCPKDYKKNRLYREYVLERARTDLEFREWCWLRASRDVVWFCDTFGWTYSPKDYRDAPYRLMVLWPFQEKAIRRIDSAIQNGRDVLIEKSRDMGASWICLYAITHRFLFRQSQSFLLGSRKEEFVDKAGDPKTLFWKIDSILDKLPGWLRPRCTRTNLHLYNHDMEGTIDGESTNENFATGDRRTAVMLDEFAKVTNGESIAAATQDVTDCRIFNSTPEGASGAYYEQRNKMLLECPDYVLQMHWSDHPLKGAGLYTTQTVHGEKVPLILDTSFTFPQNYPFVLDGRRRSPWYDLQCKRALSDQAIAKNLDIDYAGSGHPFVSADKLAIPLSRCRPWVTKGDLIWDEGIENVRFMPSLSGRLMLWFDPSTTSGRPPAGEFIVSGDIAAGNGGRYSSNSAMPAVNRDTGSKLAQFVDSNTEPRPLADYMVAMCKWFHGAKAIWENNGPGGTTFTKRFMELRYMNYYDSESDSTVSRGKTRTPGWHAGSENKTPMLEAYATALINGECDNPYKESVQEVGEFIYMTGGKVEHQKSKNTDPSASGEAHGDMATADMLAWHLCRKQDSVSREQKFKSDPPVNSPAWRHRQHQRNIKSRYHI